MYVVLHDVMYNTILPCMQCVWVGGWVGGLVHGGGRQERANGQAREEDLYSGSSDRTRAENVGTIVLDDMHYNQTITTDSNTEH